MWKQPDRSGTAAVAALFAIAAGGALCFLPDPARGPVPPPGSYLKSPAPCSPAAYSDFPYSDGCPNCLATSLHPCNNLFNPSPSGWLSRKTRNHLVLSKLETQSNPFRILTVKALVFEVDIDCVRDSRNKDFSWVLSARGAEREICKGV